jgi:hypothetical protein
VMRSERVTRKGINVKTRMAARVAGSHVGALQERDVCLLLDIRRGAVAVADLHTMVKRRARQDKTWLWLTEACLRRNTSSMRSEFMRERSNARYESQTNRDSSGFKPDLIDAA